MFGCGNDCWILLPLLALLIDFNDVNWTQLFLILALFSTTDCFSCLSGCTTTTT